MHHEVANLPGLLVRPSTLGPFHRSGRLFICRFLVRGRVRPVAKRQVGFIQLLAPLGKGRVSRLYQIVINFFNEAGWDIGLPPPVKHPGKGVGKEKFFLRPRNSHVG